MKKNTKKILVILLVAFVAVGSYLVSGTYAKYTTTVTGTGTGTVAKWSWTIFGDDITSTATASASHNFNLFATVNEADGTSSETHVATGKIAPGTGGQVQVAIVNKSEVDATYTLTLTETSNTNNIPIEYSLTGAANSWTTNLSTLTSSLSDVVIAKAADSTGTSATATIYWRWAYTGAQSENYGSGATVEQTDASDTALGFAANTTAPTVVVTATVTVTQVD